MRSILGTKRGPLLAATMLAALTVTGSASAAPPSKAPRATPTAQGKGVPPELLAKLQSDDIDEVRAGLADARLLAKKAAAAAPLVASRLAAGLPYPLAQAAIETLADIESPDGAVAIAPYTRHRDVRVRRAAVKAMGRSVGPTSGPLAVATLRVSLSDPDIQVRAAAATGLGGQKAKGAIKDLFVALDHRVYEAADSIGQLCDGPDCDALVAKMGRLPFDVITTGLDQILARPSTEISDDTKIGIVHRVRDLGTHDANRFLRAVQSRWPKGASAKVKREIDAAVGATLTSPGSDQ